MKYNVILIRSNGQDGEKTEIVVSVTATYYPPSRGHRDKYGAPEEPDEPEDLNVTSVKDQSGIEIEVTDSEMDLIIERGFQFLVETANEPDYPGDYFDTGRD